jgi:hypothetical protein
LDLGRKLHVTIRAYERKGGVWKDYVSGEGKSQQSGKNIRYAKRLVHDLHIVPGLG